MWTELPYGKIHQNIKQVAMTAVITTVVSIFAALWIWYCEDKAYYVAEILNPENYMIDILAGYPTDDFEVIGNEYDNKELLKARQRNENKN